MLCINERGPKRAAFVLHNSLLKSIRFKLIDKSFEMMIKLSPIFLFYLISLCSPVNAQSVENLLTDEKKITDWQASAFVSKEAVDAFCDEQCFSVSLISEKIFYRMQGKSFSSDCTVPRKDLRYLKVLHYTADGRIRLGEMVVNQKISKDVLEIFKTLFVHRYPIEKMVLIDNYEANDERSMADNNSSAFNFRYVQGTRVLSNHSEGMAVDINPLYNPYVVMRKNEMFVSPQSALPYADRSQNFIYKIEVDDLCVQEFKKRGFKWGGDWKSRKDYQHFEK